MSTPLERVRKDPERIYLQPECCASPDVGRLWCEDDEPVACEEGRPWTEYVRADVARAALREMEEQEPAWETEGLQCIGCGAIVQPGGMCSYECRHDTDHENGDNARAVIIRTSICPLGRAHKDGE